MRPTPPTRATEDPLLSEALEILDAVARSVSRQLGGRFSPDDLRGYAHESLSELTARFDATRGMSFRAFARVRLRGAIIDGLRRESGLPRGVAGRLRALAAADLFSREKGEEIAAVPSPTAAAADQRLSSFLRGLATAYATGLIATQDETDEGTSPGPSEHDPEALARWRQARSVLEAALDEIGDPEATLLRRHYFFDEDLQDAAAHLGLSKSWGSRLHARGIEKLSIRLAKLKGDL